MEDAFDGADVVYHLAAHISISRGEWPLLESVNVTGTRNVVEACLRRGVRRLVYFRSIHAINQMSSNSQLDESCLLVGPEYFRSYDLSKAMAEKEVLQGIEKGLDAVIISPTAMIGPHDFRPSHFG